ncbi:unnamed protein product [Adineta steineri]|uniref:Uncharacterized protein n=1 Tax=Adineta steineri TaxID=433720 RepID=A0A815PPI4_9BILA|nr:unnamed protein product [Adineta steineri]CAF1452734.1 unnamed protein product [Adineta steineri]
MLHIFSESNYLSDCIHYLINYNKQIEIAHNDINNKYQELQIKRETIKRYKQELQSMKYLFKITFKEKQIQYDQLQHGRQCQVNDMKSLLIFGRKVIVKHDDVVPERSKS